MKSYHANSGGGLASIIAKDHPIPEPGPHEILVRVQANSLNARELSGKGRKTAEKSSSKKPVSYVLQELSRGVSPLAASSAARYCHSAAALGNAGRIVDKVPSRAVGFLSEVPQSVRISSFGHLFQRAFRSGKTKANAPHRYGRNHKR
jgi:hypothetical protein